MSLGKFIHKIWEGIKSLFQSIEKKEQELVHIAVEVVERVKTILDSPVPDVITALIPGTADDLIVAKLREFLPGILEKLLIIDAANQAPDLNTRLQNIIKAINLSSDQTKNIAYHGLASLILQELSDGKLSWSDATAIAEYYYQNFVKPKTETTTIPNSEVPTDGSNS